MCWRTSRLYDSKSVSFGQVGLCKAYCTQRAREVVAQAREIVGGNGILRDFGVASAFTDIEATYTFGMCHSIPPPWLYLFLLCFSLQRALMTSTCCKFNSSLKKCMCVC